ncbi:MAG: AAA family ATPase [Phycisphaerales bacterium]|nr:AAA family ATPase [Phycisphaerales bacterium]
MSKFIEHLRPNFELVAITDHMKCGFAANLSAASRASMLPLVLPGMEVSIRGEAAISTLRIHLLTILPEGKSVEAFSRLFANLDIPDDASRTGHEEIVGVPIKEWVKRVHAEGGICIAAHVNSNQGIRQHFRQAGRNIIKLVATDAESQSLQEKDLTEELKEYMLDAEFDAIEVSRASDQRHYRWESSVRGHNVTIPVTLQFDSHCIEEYNRPERTTWIKMTDVGFDGLRNALLFPETRVRFPSDLPTPPIPQLLGIQIAGGEGSLFENETIAFAENLNCLIGPRGAGKSTIVEAIRYLFGYNRTLSELDTANKLSERIREMQRANLTGCLIRVAYRVSSGDTRILEATFDPQEDYTTKIYSENGEPLEIADLEATGEFPLRLFGWSEIETLGRDKGRQRDLLDRLVPDLGDAKSRRADVRARLEENRQALKGIIGILSSLLEKDGGVIRRYVEYRAAFNKLNTNDIKGHFTELDSANLRLSLFNLVLKNIERFRTKIDGLDIAGLREGIHELLGGAPEPTKEWWVAHGESLTALTENEADLSESLRLIRNTLAKVESTVRGQIEKTKKEIEEVELRIRSSFADDADMRKIADLRANAEKRLKQAIAVRTDYTRAWKQLTDCLGDRKGLTESLLRIQNEIAGIRVANNEKIERTLNQHFGDGIKVKLHFRAGGDKSAFVDALIKSKIAHAFSGRYKARRIPEILAENFDPVSVVQNLVRGNSASFAGAQLAEDAGARITAEEAKKGTETWQYAMVDEAAEVQVLNDLGETLKKLVYMQQVEWDDEESILLDGRPVGELSPGQRSSAMLPLIALAETTPLVIDQPEDNLDNKLIGHVLAGILASLKERRQIIVCTHNPNIVVSGDAEQVIVLDAISDRRAKVEAHGSIDNTDIIQSVIDIMEGGRDAFLVRHRRYGIRVPNAAS